MQSKSETENRLHADHHTIPPNSVYSEPWWRGVGYNPISPAVTGRNASNSSSLECPNGGSESNDDRSLSNDEPNEDDDDDATKESQITSPRSGDNSYNIWWFGINFTSLLVSRFNILFQLQLAMMGKSAKICRMLDLLYLQFVMIALRNRHSLSLLVTLL